MNHSPITEQVDEVLDDRQLRQCSAELAEVWWSLMCLVAGYAAMEASRLDRALMRLTPKQRAEFLQLKKWKTYNDDAAKQAGGHW